MPVVSKQKMYIDDSLREYMREIKYSSKDGQFSAELPEKVVTHLMLNKKIVTANSESAAATAWENIIIEYNEAKRETSTVILFRIKLNGFVPPADRPFLQQGDHNKELFQLYETQIERFDSKGLGMFIEWGIYKKEFYKEKKKYSAIPYYNIDSQKERKIGTGFNETYLEDKVGKSIKEIPYSEERQAWFTNLQLSIESLLIKIKHKLASLTNEELLQLVDSNGFKLLN